MRVWRRGDDNLDVLNVLTQNLKLAEVYSLDIEFFSKTLTNTTILQMLKPQFLPILGLKSRHIVTRLLDF